MLLPLGAALLQRGDGKLHPCRWIAALCAAAVVLSFVRLGEDRLLLLNVTVPESLNIAHGFDDIFTQYTKKHRHIRTKTSNMGSLYKLFYKVELKDRRKMQEFIDPIGQLEFEGYTNSEAIYAVENCGADWNEPALKKAKDYMDFSAFSEI